MTTQYDIINNELINVVYDTIFNNTQHINLKDLDVSNQFVNNSIYFDYTEEDTIYTVKLSLEVVKQRFFLDEEEG